MSYSFNKREDLVITPSQIAYISTSQTTLKYLIIKKKTTLKYHI